MMSETTPPTQQTPRPPLRGRFLLIVRIVWSTLAVMVITVFVASIPVYFGYEVEKANAIEALLAKELPVRLGDDYLPIWQATAGHPYFLQLLCHSLVNRHNKTERNYVTVADVNGALDEILASGEAHFVVLWATAEPTERLVMAALSRMMPMTGRATLVQVADYLAERGVSLERQAISDALHQLALRDVLFADSEVAPTVGQVYRWRLGLLGCGWRNTSR